ncbi:MAG: hypothetical protein LBQ28_09200 [Prevotellaceae bacterium]|jgi:hypothetical protein|nr:hypothetical protein [Prevotellaceae bacterium]
MTKEQIKDYFDRYPQSVEVYEADDRLFHTLGAAMSISAEPKKWTRKEVEASKAESQNFVDIDLSALKQQELLKLAKELNVQTDDNKKETLLAALLEKQNELKQQHNNGNGED